MNNTSPTSIMVVDDAIENLRLLSAIIRKVGLVPRPVTSGKRAIEAAVVDPPDLVLLDIRMPEMSGFEVCRWFKRCTSCHARRAGKSPLKTGHILTNTVVTSP